MQIQFYLSTTSELILVFRCIKYYHLHLCFFVFYYLLIRLWSKSISMYILRRMESQHSCTPQHVAFPMMLWKFSSGRVLTRRLGIRWLHRITLSLSCLFISNDFITFLSPTFSICVWQPELLLILRLIAISTYLFLHLPRPMIHYQGGETALMRAARICSSTDTLEILLRFGADKDAKNEKDVSRSKEVPLDPSSTVIILLRSSRVTYYSELP